MVDTHLATIDLLLSDMHLPGMSGLQFAETIRRQRPNIHVILMSGYDQIGGVRESNWQFLGKPFTVRQLVAKIDDMLQSDAVRIS